MTTNLTLLAAENSGASAGYWLGLHPLDWVVLALYFVVVLGVGAWSYLKVSNEADYFMGGRRFGKIFMMFFAFGSGTSSEQAVSVAAGSFRTGLAGIWYQFLWLFATPFYWIIAPVMRRMRALTTSDFFEARFSSSTSLLYSMIGIMISIVFIGGGLFASAKMIEGLAGGTNPATGDPYFPASYAIAAMTFMFVVYGLAGGLGAAIITDFIQGVLTIIFSFLLLPFALYYAADVAGFEPSIAKGFEALHAGTPEFPGDKILSLTVDEKFAKETGKELITPFYILMLSLNGLIGIVVQPHIMGVCGAGKTEMEGRVGFTFGNFIKRFCTIAWSFTGLACIIIYLTPENGFIDSATLEELHSDPKAMTEFADQVFGNAAHDILPKISHGLVGLLMAALLAAVMSTCDAQMVVASGLFTENIYKRYLAKEKSRKHYLWVGRLAGLVVVALSLLLMTQFDNVIQVLKDYIIPIPAFIGLAFWFGIVWRGFTPAAVWVSTFVAGLFWYLTQTHTPFEFIAGLGDSEFLKQNIDYFPHLFRDRLHDWIPSIMAAQENAAGEIVNYKTSTPHQYLIYLSAGALAGIISSLMSKRTPKEKLDHFFTLIRTPITPGEEVVTPCTLPENHLPPETDKLINLPDLEIPMPTKVGMIGFLGSWVMVGAVIVLTYWLAGLGG